MSTSAEHMAFADEFAGDAASFVGAVESVADGNNPSAAVSVLILALSGILASGAKLGAQEDIEAPQGPSAAELGTPRPADYLSAGLAEQFGSVDQYYEVVDPYLGDHVAVGRLSQDLADICGDLLHGLALYTEGHLEAALAWWQYTYLSNWGPAASAALRAVQSLIALVRLGAPMGAPTDPI